MGFWKDLKMRVEAAVIDWRVSHDKEVMNSRLSQEKKDEMYDNIVQELKRRGVWNDK